MRDFVWFNRAWQCVPRISFTSCTQTLSLCNYGGNFFTPHCVRHTNVGRHLQANSSRKEHHNSIHNSKKVLADEDCSPPKHRCRSLCDRPFWLALKCSEKPLSTRTDSLTSCSLLDAFTFVPTYFPIVPSLSHLTSIIGTISWSWFVWGSTSSRKWSKANNMQSTSFGQFTENFSIFTFLQTFQRTEKCYPLLFHHKSSHSHHLKIIPKELCL